MAQIAAAFYPLSCHAFVLCYICFGQLQLVLCVTISILLVQIQSEGYYLQLGAKDALLHALLLAAERFSLGPPQVLYLETYVLVCTI